ncbi:hypothetical protein EUTSA_v10022809mg [Eutrema salsugineum]|uniref:Bifunctional inhibitor/plant lipid transfer protein/seed storage helical domain-containing protein n=1 Tax=Eutrema salsugineum TaxID=72664 RepID=V4MF68_EUTSA|nr:hypothetical protein EUTSA_v10022809mg [Eutrema salsugineum]
MDSSKLSLLSLCLLICIICSPQHSLSCGSCNHQKGGLPSIKPPVTIPKLPVPPVTVPKVPVPPVTVPKVPVPPVTVPELPLPPVGGLPTLPLPPLPGTIPPATGGKDCPPTPGSEMPPSGSGKATCPIDTLKLGACVDLLGGLVKIGLGDPAVNKCCPLLKGLVEVEAAACLCTTLKLKALNLKLYVPVALQLLLTCGKNPPPGYTCSI